MKQRIVIGLGGNALSAANETPKEQEKRVQSACRRILPILSEGNEVILTHGNGPQVGALLTMRFGDRTSTSKELPLHTCVAMTQGSMGDWILHGLYQEFARQHLSQEAVALVTETVVQRDDPAFAHPSKPIGAFLTEPEARLAMESEGTSYQEDAGRGWRRVVASPKPVDLVGITPVKDLVQRGHVVICGGGGGIPVVETDEGYEAVEAVVDKDWTSECIAEKTDADMLILLTGVDCVSLFYHTPQERPLHRVSVSEMQGYVEQKQFAEGSMLPKVQACMQFVQSRAGRHAFITSIEKLPELTRGAGTEIVADSAH